MTLTKKKPRKSHKPARGQTVKARRHRLHVPPGGSFTFTPTAMSQAMVDRLFWRAGFGPSAADRAAWIGKPLDDAVDALLNTPQGALVGPEPTRDGKALDPTGDDTDLVLAWVDRMVRTSNPLVERMTFFWHRHWANSRDAVSPTQLLLNQNDAAAQVRRLRREPGRLVPRHGSRGLQGPVDAAVPERRVQRQGRAERELRPRVHGAVRARRDARHHRRPNYTENDVAQLAKSLTGWYIDDKDPDNAKALFDSGRWFNGPKSLFGKLGNYNTDTRRRPGADQDGHGPYLVKKLWGEFMPTPPVDGDAAGSSPPIHGAAAASSSRSCAASSPTRSCSSRSTSPT